MDDDTFFENLRKISALLIFSGLLFISSLVLFTLFREDDQFTRASVNMFSSGIFGTITSFAYLSWKWFVGSLARREFVSRTEKFLSDIAVNIVYVVLIFSSFAFVAALASGFYILLLQPIFVTVNVYYASAFSAYIVTILVMYYISEAIRGPLRMRTRNSAFYIGLLALSGVMVVLLVYINLSLITDATVLLYDGFGIALGLLFGYSFVRRRLKKRMLGKRELEKMMLRESYSSEETYR